MEMNFENAFEAFKNELNLMSDKEFFSLAGLTTNDINQINSRNLNNKIKPSLYYLIGLPASGKSYYAEKISNIFNANIHSSDNIREELYQDITMEMDYNFSAYVVQAL